MNNNQSKDYSLVNDTFQGQTKRILKQISQINLTCISKSQIARAKPVGYL